MKYNLRSAVLLPMYETCYTHLHCQRGNSTWCLDWRDVCNNRADCWPEHVDEHHCDELEANECGADEYRCTNGLCIPEVFLLDNTLVSDCIDQSDEIRSNRDTIVNRCESIEEPSFRCADTACQHWTYFHAGASCASRKAAPFQSDYRFFVEQTDLDMLSPSANGHINEDCWLTMVCLTRAHETMQLVSSDFIA